MLTQDLKGCSLAARWSWWHVDYYYHYCSKGVQFYGGWDIFKGLAHFSLAWMCIWVSAEVRDHAYHWNTFLSIIGEGKVALHPKLRLRVCDVVLDQQQYQLRLETERNVGNILFKRRPIGRWMKLSSVKSSLKSILPLSDSVSQSLQIHWISAQKHEASVLMFVFANILRRCRVPPPCPRLWVCFKSHSGSFQCRMDTCAWSMH